MKLKKASLVTIALVAVTLIASLFGFQAFFAKGVIAPTLEWSRTFGGSGNDGGNYVIQTSDNGYVLAGFQTISGNNHDFYIAKNDASGTLVWSRTYGEVGIDDAYCVIETSDGGYALTGFTNSSGAGNYDGWLVKVDSSGNMQWNKTYGGATADDLYTIIQTPDNGYVLSGYTTSFGAGAADGRLIKVDSAGNLLWSQTYGGTGVDDIISMTKTEDGGYTLVGFTRSYSIGGTDFWLAKVDSQGNLQWNKTYGRTADDSAHSVVQTDDGGFALAGFTSSFGSGDRDFWLVKVDSQGNMQWNKTFGGSGSDDAVSLITTNDGSYVLVGSTTSYGAGNSDIWAVKADLNGSLLWSQTLGGSGADYACKIIQTSEGGYALIGNTASFGVSGTDTYFIKLAPENPSSSPTQSPTNNPTTAPSQTPIQTHNTSPTAKPTAPSGPTPTTHPSPAPTPSTSPIPTETTQTKDQENPIVLYIIAAGIAFALLGATVFFLKKKH